MTEPMMDVDSVVALMMSSTDVEDWNNNCDAVKHDKGGKYPEFWFLAIILPGVLVEKQLSWEKEDAMQRM